jgi:hypothetical protein
VHVRIYIYIYMCVCVMGRIICCSVYNMLETIRDFKTPQKVLILGVGRSNVIDVLYEHGFREITCIDISPKIISQMQNKYRQHSGVDCECLLLVYIYTWNSVEACTNNDFPVAT